MANASLTVTSGVGNDTSEAHSPSDNMDICDDDTSPTIQPSSNKKGSTKKAKARGKRAAKVKGTAEVKAHVPVKKGRQKARHLNSTTSPDSNTDNIENEPRRTRPKRGVEPVTAIENASTNDPPQVAVKEFAFEKGQEYEISGNRRGTFQKGR